MKYVPKLNLKSKKSDTFPLENGLYWARSNSDYRWFNLIVTIEGEAPRLYVARTTDLAKDTVSKANDWDVWFGPKIEQPEPQFYTS